MPGWLLWTAAEEWHGVAGSVSPAANGSTDDAPVPKGLPPPAPPKGLEEGFPKGDAELLPLTSPKGLPAHLVTDVHRRSRARGRRDGAEMDHDVCAPYAIAPYPNDAQRNPGVPSLIFFWTGPPREPSTLRAWNTRQPCCAGSGQTFLGVDSQYAVGCRRGNAVALRVPFTFVTRSGPDASSDVGRSRVVVESSFERMRGRESWGPSLVGSVYAMPHKL